MDENERRASELNKREENGKYDDNNLIIDETEAAGNVIDIYTLLATSGEPTIIKLRNLMASGVTEKEVVDTYESMDGNAETIDEAVKKLDIVFYGLARVFSELSNGVVVDIKTGLIDREASIEQMYEVGILSNDGVIENMKMSSKEGLEEILRKLEPNEQEIEAAKETFELKKMFFKFMANEYNDYANLEMMMNMNASDLNISEEEKEDVTKLQEKIKHSDYFLDKELYNICSLYLAAEEKSGTAEHAAIMHQLRSAIKRHPEKAQEATRRLFKEDGTLNLAGVLEFKKYETDQKKLSLFGQISVFNDMDVNKMDPEHKKAFFTMALAMQEFTTYENEKPFEKEAFRIMSRLDPRITVDMKRADFYQCVSDAMGFSIRRANEYRDAVKVAGISLDKAFDAMRDKIYDENGLVTDQEFEGSINEKDFHEILVDTVGMEMTKANMRNLDTTPAQNYFKGTRIKFDEEDEKAFDQEYMNCTVKSWIRNKEVALLYRHIALLEAKDKLLSKPQTEYYRNKLEIINQQIADFEKEHGEYAEVNENGEIDPYQLQMFDDYKQRLHDAGLYKYYSIDMNLYQDNKGYYDLDDEHKKAYLRNIMVGLDYVDRAGDEAFESVLGKLNLRRLELLNDRDAGKVFVSFDKDGNPKINKELILQEYQSMSRHTWNSYEELQDAAVEAKERYVLKKLEEYEHLPEDQFYDPYVYELNDAGTRILNQEATLRNIEDIRMRYNAKLAMQDKTAEVEPETTVIQERVENQGQMPAVEFVNVYGENSIDRVEEPVVESIPVSPTNTTITSVEENKLTQEEQSNPNIQTVQTVQTNSEGIFGKIRGGLAKIKNVFTAMSEGKGVIDAIKDEFKPVEQLPPGGTGTTIKEQPPAVGTSSQSKNDQTKPRQYKIDERIDVDHQAALRKSDQTATKTPEDPDVGVEIE